MRTHRVKEQFNGRSSKFLTFEILTFCSQRSLTSVLSRFEIKCGQVSLCQLLTAERPLRRGTADLANTSSTFISVNENQGEPPTS
jgi:hypothetical protein